MKRSVIIELYRRSQPLQELLRKRKKAARIKQKIRTSEDIDQAEVAASRMFEWFNDIDILKKLTTGK